jgi:Tol biopolymer transport system component/putative intracellular protease/amidase
MIPRNFADITPLVPVVLLTLLTGVSPSAPPAPAATVPVAATPAAERPVIAILIYEGVQIIDFAVPFEVFGQFGQNQVITVARDSTAITTYMGLTVVPDRVLGDHPPVDVLVLPGGAGTSAIGRDPSVRAWIDRTVEEARYVLTTCTGIFLLVDGGHLAGRRVTTWYGRQDDLRAAVPDAEVIEEEIVVEDGKFVTSAGTGLEAALHVTSLLHGDAWSELIRLNMEYEPNPEHHHMPRVLLADLRLPESIYASFPWRGAEFLAYEGDYDAWTMAWRFESTLPLDSLATQFIIGLREEDGWREIRQETGTGGRSVTGRLPASGAPSPRVGAEPSRVDSPVGGWWGWMELTRASVGVYELAVGVHRGERPPADGCTGTDPAWSPDSEWLAYVEWCGEEADLYRVRADGSGRRRLTRSAGHEYTPAWSPDGRRIAYAYSAEGEKSEIWTVHADGSHAEQITDDRFSQLGPTWSPDGTSIAYESEREGNADIYVLDLGTREEVRLTAGPSRDVAPAWSPDGLTIAFQSNRDGRYGIWGVAPTGGPARRLFTPEAAVTTPDWSPDGRELVVAHHGEGRGELFRVSVEDGAAVRLTSNDRVDFQPRWSPDGRGLAFIVRDGERWNVVVLDLESGQEQRPAGR